METAVKTTLATNVTEAEITRVLDFIRQNPGCSNQDITDAKAASKIKLFYCIKSLKDSGQISVGTVGNRGKQVFTAIEDAAPAASVTVAPEDSALADEIAAEVQLVEPQDAPFAETAEEALAAAEAEEKEKTNRNYDRIIFNGFEFPKGRFILAVVKFLVHKHNIQTIGELNELMPPALNKKWGIVRDLADAKKASEKHRRFFLNKEDIIVLGNGKKYAVSNQWGTPNIPPVIDHVTKVLKLKVSFISKEELAERKALAAKAEKTKKAEKAPKAKKAEKNLANKKTSNKKATATA